VLTDAQKLDWLRLIRSDNVGPRIFRDLINRFGGADAALNALPALARQGGRRDIRIASRDEAEREFAAIKKHGAHLVALGEAHYPPRLRMIDDAPPLLTVRGNLGVLGQPMVALVGARNASAAGVKVAERLARDLGDAGYVIASGLARGIDAAAHRASLETGTVAVLAGGHSRIYPSEHEPLVEALLPHGAAISEMPIDWEPRAHDFPRRNRLISGLSVGVVIVEAAKRSGSLITDATDVIVAIEPILGRPIEQAIEEPEHTPATNEPGGDERSRIVALLGPTPVSIDDLVRLSQSSAAIVRTVLLELELAGRLERHGGGLVSLI
jgi:DNA processing protein